MLNAIVLTMRSVGTCLQGTYNNNNYDDERVQVTVMMWTCAGRDPVSVPVLYMYSQRLNHQLRIVTMHRQPQHETCG